MNPTLLTEAAKRFGYELPAGGSWSAMGWGYQAWLVDVGDFHRTSRAAIAYVGGDGRWRVSVAAKTGAFTFVAEA